MISYVGLDEIKQTLDVTGATYDAVLARMASHASALMDDAAGRRFAPQRLTMTIDSNGGDELWLPESLLEMDELAVSFDDGASYTPLVQAVDYWLSDGVTYGRSPAALVIRAGDVWPRGRRAVQISGLWGYHRQYAAAWAAVDTLTTAVDATTTTLTAADVDAPGESGGPRLQVGQLVRVEQELCAVLAVGPVDNSLVVVRGVNGSTATPHAEGTALRVWRAEPLVRQYALMQAVRWFKRGQSAFQDVTAAVETGQLTFARKIDPEVEFGLLQTGLRRVTV